MNVSDIFGRIAVTILIIAAGVALLMVAFNNWQTTVLSENVGIFYFFGVLFVVSIIIAIIAAVWDN
jgi:hypothetical protein